jgi:hypothetical protein
VGLAQGFAKQTAARADRLLLLAWMWWRSPHRRPERLLSLPPFLVQPRKFQSDPDFCASDFVRLEVLPKPFPFRLQAEGDFYEAYFALVTEMVEASPTRVRQAYAAAQQVGLAGMDALHIAAAKATGAEEFITTERPTTALFRVTGMTITSLRTS